MCANPANKNSWLGRLLGTGSKPRTQRPAPGAPRRRPPGPGQRPAQDSFHLPFEQRQRRKDAGDWIYHHRVGLLVTVVLYLVAGILFVTYRIVIIKAPEPVTYVELVNPDDIPPEEMPQEEVELIEPEYYDRITNRISDENARLDPSLRDDRGSRSQQIYEEAQRVQEQIAAGQQNYRQGMNEIEQMRNQQRDSERATNTTNESSPRQDVKQQGNVTVSYNLEGRTAVYLHVPAYQCKEGGTVIVDITVNRSGDVVSASLNKSTSSPGSCISERAVQAARASSFNASASAPDRQRGTITYIFVPQ